MGSPSHDDVCTLMMAVTAFGNIASENLDDSVFDMRSTLIAFCYLGRDSGTTPGELQEQTRLSTSGVTRLLDRMQDNGWVKRRYGSNIEDRRNVQITLTAKGRRQSQVLTTAIARSLRANGSTVARLRQALDPFMPR